MGFNEKLAWLKEQYHKTKNLENELIEGGFFQKEYRNLPIYELTDERFNQLDKKEIEKLRAEKASWCADVFRHIKTEIIEVVLN